MMMPSYLLPRRSSLWQYLRTSSLIQRIGLSVSLEVVWFSLAQAMEGEEASTWVTWQPDWAATKDAMPV